MTDYAKKLYSMKSAKTSKSDASHGSPRKAPAASREDQSSRIYSMQAEKSSAEHNDGQVPEKKKISSETHDTMEKADMKNLGPDETKTGRHSGKEKTAGTSGNMSGRPHPDKPIPSKPDTGRPVSSRPLKASSEAALSTKQAEPGRSSQPSGKTESLQNTAQQEQKNQPENTGKPENLNKPDNLNKPERTKRLDHAEPVGESSESREKEGAGRTDEISHADDSSRTKSPEEQTPSSLRPKLPPLQPHADRQTHAESPSVSHTDHPDQRDRKEQKFSKDQAGQKDRKDQAEHPDQTIGMAQKKHSEQSAEAVRKEHAEQIAQTDQPPEKRTQYKKKIKGVGDIQKKRRRRRLIMIITAVTLLVAIGAAYYVYQVQQQQAAAAAAAQARQVYQVTRVIYQEQVDISGNVTAYDSQQPYFRMSGTVEAVYAEEGDRIEAGELIAELDDAEIQYELAQLDYQIEQNELEGSLRQLELNRMQRNILESRLEKTKLFAPISGTLTELNIEAGDMVTAGSSTAVGKIVDVSALKASVEVDEYDINRVKIGQRAELTFDALGDATKVEAVVDSIPLEGHVTSEGIAVKYIDLLIEEVPEGISPSYSFSGVILAGEEQEILTVPENAIIEQPDGTEVLMVQRTDGSVTQVQVTTETLNDGTIRILSGNVSAGDTVVVSNADADGFPMPGGGAPFPGMGGGRR